MLEALLLHAKLVVTLRQQFSDLVVFALQLRHLILLKLLELALETLALQVETPQLQLSLIRIFLFALELFFVLSF